MVLVYVVRFHVCARANLERQHLLWSDLNQKARFSVYRSIFVPTFTYGHELWVETDRMRSRIQVAVVSSTGWLDSHLEIGEEVESFGRDSK